MNENEKRDKLIEKATVYIKERLPDIKDYESAFDDSDYDLYLMYRRYIVHLDFSVEYDSCKVRIFERVFKPKKIVLSDYDDFGL
jgi:hypothetical protein